MLPENNLAISMLNDMKKIDDDIRSELEKMKLENRSGDDEKKQPTRSTKTTTATTNTQTTAASNSNSNSSRQRIKIQNLDAYLKSTSSDMMLTLMDEDDSNEFYRLPSSLSTSAKIITSLDTTTSTLTTNKESGNNVYEKLSDVTSTVVRPAASNNTPAIISTISKLNDENGEVEVEIRKEQPTAAANIDSDKKNNSLYDFLTLNLDRYCYNLY